MWNGFIELPRGPTTYEVHPQKNMCTPDVSILLSSVITPSSYVCKLCEKTCVKAYNDHVSNEHLSHIKVTTGGLKPTCQDGTASVGKPRHAMAIAAQNPMNSNPAISCPAGDISPAAKASVYCEKAKLLLRAATEVAGQESEEYQQKPARSSLDDPDFLPEEEPELVETEDWCEPPDEDWEKEIFRQQECSGETHRP